MKLGIKNSWKNLNYWNTGEWQVVQERLDDLKAQGVLVCPSRKCIFEALRTTPLESVSVAIIGQDPYPSSRYATGTAFSIPRDVTPFPPSLINIFKEYKDDLHYDDPCNGDLSLWVKQGVLLWNTFPTCNFGKPGSHHWDEWRLLSEEVVQRIDLQGAVFILLGNEARSLSRCITSGKSKFIETSHPSPLGAKHGFFGSRIFSRANGLLKELGKPYIDWRLSCTTKENPLEVG